MIHSDETNVWAHSGRTRLVHRAIHSIGVIAAIGLMLFTKGVAHAESERAEAGTYVTARGEIRDAEKTYDQLHDTEEPRPWRAAGEMAGMLSVGTAWYWATRGDNARDWDDTQFIGRVNGDAWSLDNNGLDVNFLFHAFSGTAYYGVARANHLSLPAAYGYAFGTSFLWEFALEFNERISISDTLVTPSSGLVIGEYLHKLSWYLNGVPRHASATKDALRWSPLGASVALHRAWDGAEPPPVLEQDNLGYSSWIWHDFEADARFASVHANDVGSTGQYSVGHRGELVTIPGFLRPGNHHRFFGRADFSTLEVRAFGSQHGAGIDFRADTLLLGWFEQEWSSHRESARGIAYAVGVNLAHRYLDTRANGLHEFYGVLHLPGPGLDVWARAGEFRARLAARAQPDFAGVGSLAYPFWFEENRGVRTKNVLTKQGYYYGWGYSARTRGAVSLGPLEWVGAASIGRYDSQEGLDRAQDEVVIDLDAKDQLAEWSLGLDLIPVDVESNGWGLRLGADWLERRWSSRAGEFRVHRKVRELGGHAAVLF